MAKNMFKQIYKVDDNGFIADTYVGEFNENGALIEPNGNFITVDLPQPLYFRKPKWNGNEWVEGESEEERAERESQQLLESLKPTPEELANAELEIKMITILSELGVVQ